MASFKRQYPAALQFAFGTPKCEKPFLVRSIWHDGQFTYIKSDAQELPALVRSEGRSALARQFPGAEAARTSCRRCSSVGISRSARTAFRSNKDGRVWQTLNSVAASVTDHRIAPRGVLPRRTQTWLMVGVAVGILGIIVITGHPEPAGRPTGPVASTPLAPNPERLRDYQDRLRIMDERARQQALSVNDSGPTAISRPVSEETPGAAGTTDPLMGERRRREYESLFASNVVMSRRPDGHQLATAAGPASPASRGSSDRRWRGQPAQHRRCRERGRAGDESVRARHAGVHDDRTGGRGSRRCQFDAGHRERGGCQGDPGVYGTHHVHGPDASPRWRARSWTRC